MRSLRSGHRPVQAAGRCLLPPPLPPAIPRLPTTYHASLAASSPSRALHITAPQDMAYKDAQDRQSVKTNSTENTKSGRDEDLAQSEAAYDPSTTRPEAEKSKVDGPLEVSGANQEMSKPMGDERAEEKKRGAGEETTKGGKSGRGGAPKKGSVKDMPKDV